MVPARSLRLASIGWPLTWRNSELGFAGENVNSMLESDVGVQCNYTGYIIAKKK